MSRKKGRGYWRGGYIRWTKSGRGVFVIERWAGGRRIHISTGCSEKEAADEELARFEKDPDRYRPRLRGAAPGALTLSVELIEGFHNFQVASGVSHEWADEMSRSLKQWMPVLGLKDLRTISLHQDLKPALKEWKTRIPHRIKAIRGLYTWLVEEDGRLEPRDNPTTALHTPPVVAEKTRRRKVVPFEDLEKVYRVLSEKEATRQTADVLSLQAGTGLHTSEIRRFARGQGELVPAPAGQTEVLAVLIVKHKGGEWHPAPLQFHEHIACAERIQARGSIPNRMSLSRQMRAACDAAKVQRFHLGQIRHTVLSEGADWGTGGAQASATFAGHKSKRTTEKFYLDRAMPAPPIPVFRLGE